MDVVSSSLRRVPAMAKEALSFVPASGDLSGYRTA